MFWVDFHSCCWFLWFRQINRRRHFWKSQTRHPYSNRTKSITIYIYTIFIYSLLPFLHSFIHSFILFILALVLLLFLSFILSSLFLLFFFIHFFVAFYCFYMAFVRLYVAFMWLLYGFCVAFMWLLLGFCMAFVRLLFGFCAAFVWLFVAFVWLNDFVRILILCCFLFCVFLLFLFFVEYSCFRLRLKYLRRIGLRKSQMSKELQGKFIFWN